MKRTPPAVGFGALALFAALVIVVAEGSLDAHAQAAPSISIELSPGDHLPNTVPLTAEVTLSNLDPASYSELTFRADLTGHESRTSHCYGEDTGTDIAVPVDESEEVLTVRLFKTCVYVPGGFGTYDYTLNVSISRADTLNPGDKIALASTRLTFLLTRYLAADDQYGPPPEPDALAWMDPDPRASPMHVGEWRRFRFRSSIPRYPEDHLNVYLNSSQTGSFHGVGGLDTPPGDALEACSGERHLQNWRRAIHQTLWVVACEPGPAVFLLRHETQGVAPLYQYEFDVLPARNADSPPGINPVNTNVPSAPVFSIAPTPRAPAGTEAGFGWNVERDIDPLAEANDAATGLWSDGETLWVAQNSDGVGDSVYAYDLATGERAEDRDIALDDANRAPRGLWSDGSVMWVADSGKNRLFAYDLTSGTRLPEREIELARGNVGARGIWSDDEAMWVLDGVDDSVYVYDLDTGEVAAAYDLGASNRDPHGIWSDRVGVWVSDGQERKLLAYRLEGAELVRVGDEDFTTLRGAGNNSPRGIWSGGSVMYVADANDDKVYSYNMPDGIDARLASLTLTHIDIGEFSPDRPEYTGILSGGAGKTVIEALPVQDGATVAIVPTDVDGDLENGHQAAVDAGTEVTVTVTSEDGARKREYRVLIEVRECLDGLADDFRLVTYEGGGIGALEACARRLSVTAVYAWDGDAYVSYILGAPALVNERFVALFPNGIPAGTSVVARPPTPSPAVAPAVASDVAPDVGADAAPNE